MNKTCYDWMLKSCATHMCAKRGEKHTNGVLMCLLRLFRGGI